VVALDDFAGRALVLYFYPKADTPGCTREAQAFSALRPAFEKAGAAVLGASADPVRAQEKFKKKYGLSIALASDEALKMLADYGVWVEKSMYGRKFMGVERATFLIGPDGQLAHIWRNVKVDGHAEEVLAAVRGLEKSG
jgi:peroxiredoxin Q/BCP